MIGPGGFMAGPKPMATPSPAVRLTRPQRTLLEALPEAPSDGRYVKGAGLKIAFNLVRMGLARTVGLGMDRGGRFVITPEGKEALR
jgi:hypothetical protein